MRWTLALWCGALLCAHAMAAPKTCLVLGGGGARGGAHIGVLKVLEQSRIKIDCITGTSMGAIVGSLYAAGYSADQIENILTTIDWSDAFRDDPARRDLPMRRKDNDYRLLINLELGFKDGSMIGPRGIVQGQKILLLMRRHLLPVAPIESFDNLPIPFRAVATNIADGSAYVFEGGDLAMAVRASMSVPGAFQPIRVDGHLLVDGFIANNVPIDVARAMGAERLIVVDVSDPPAKIESLSSALSVSGQALTLLSNRETRRQLETLTDRDVLIVPPLDGFSAGAFDDLKTAIEKGQEGAIARQSALAHFASSEADYAAFAAAHRVPVRAARRIAFVDVIDGRSDSAQYVTRRVASLKGQPLDPEIIEATVKSAYGEGQYERITWREVERDGEQGIEVTPVDKGWGPNFLKFGLGISDDLSGDSSYQLGADLRVTGIGDRGGEWRTFAQLGSRTGIATEYYQRFGELGSLYLRPYAELGGRRLRFQVSRIEESEYWLRTARVGFEGGYTPTDNYRLYAGLESGYTIATLRTGRPLALIENQPIATREESPYGLVRFGFAYDTLSDAAFPETGSRYDARIDLFTDLLGSDGDEQRVAVRAHRAWRRGPYRLIAGLELAGNVQESSNLAARNYLGGLGRLSGYRQDQLSGQYTGLGRLIWLRRFGDATRLFATPVYLGGTIETGGAFESRVGVNDEWTRFAASAFLGVDTFLGPMFFGLGGNDKGEKSLYLQFGPLMQPLEQ